MGSTRLINCKTVLPSSHVTEVNFLSMSAGSELGNLAQLVGLRWNLKMVDLAGVRMILGGGFFFFVFFPARGASHSAGGRVGRFMAAKGKSICVRYFPRPMGRLRTPRCRREGALGGANH